MRATGLSPHHASLRLSSVAAVISRRHEGPGEMGKAVVIPKDEQEKMKELFKINQFNLMASDMIALNRSLPDVRLDGCVSLVLSDCVSLLSKVPLSLFCKNRHYYYANYLKPFFRGVVFLFWKSSSIQNKMAGQLGSFTHQMSLSRAADTVCACRWNELNYHSNIAAVIKLVCWSIMSYWHQ